MPRGSRELFEKRLKEVEKLLDKGTPVIDIVKKLSQKFKVTPSAIRNMINKAHAIADAEVSRNRPALRYVHRNKLISLYEKAEAEKNYAVCVKILGALAKLDGLDEAPGGPIITINTIDIAALTPGEKESRIKALLKKRDLPQLPPIPVEVTTVEEPSEES